MTLYKLLEHAAVLSVGKGGNSELLKLEIVLLLGILDSHMSTATLSPESCPSSLFNLEFGVPNSTLFKILAIEIILKQRKERQDIN